MMTSVERKAKTLYDKGLLSKADLRRMVDAGKVSAEAYEAITGEPYVG